MTQDSYEADGVIVKGELKPLALLAFRQAMKRFPDGARVVIGVKVLKPRRSTQQNKYWHGVVIPYFMDHFNEHRPAGTAAYTFEQVKDILARKLLPTSEVIDPETGETFCVLGKTSLLSTTEFNDLKERAQVWGAELGLYVPDPNEMGFAA